MKIFVILDNKSDQEEKHFSTVDQKIKDHRSRRECSTFDLCAMQSSNNNITHVLARANRLIEMCNDILLDERC